jgi:hypothetical protein
MPGDCSHPDFVFDCGPFKKYKNDRNFMALFAIIRLLNA